MTIPPPLPLVTVFRTISVPDTAIPVAPPPWNESAPPSDSALLLLSVLAVRSTVPVSERPAPDTAPHSLTVQLLSATTPFSSSREIPPPDKPAVLRSKMQSENVATSTW